MNIGAFAAVVDGIKLTTLGSLILANFALGVILAIKRKEFQWSYLYHFIDSDVLGLIGGYYILGFTALFRPEIIPAVWAAWAAIDLKLIVDLKDKIKAFGLPTDFEEK